MKDLLVLRDLECVKAIAHPRRIDILNAFDKEPLSAKQLSEMLDEPHAKINYHIKTLYNVGILELVEEKIKSGIVEKYYYPTANNVVMSRKIIDYTLDPASKDGAVSISDFEDELKNTINNKVSEILANRKENDEVKKHDLMMVAIPTDLDNEIAE